MKDGCTAETLRKWARQAEAGMESPADSRSNS
jgi:hypothetical protein